MSKHQEFVERLRGRIAAQQGRSVRKISISQAAKEMEVPETTLRSTLEGRYPRTETYWRALRVYCDVDLDWLICGLGPSPEEKAREKAAKRILVVEKDLDRLGLLRLALKDYLVDVARSAPEALRQLDERSYDLVLAGDVLAGNQEAVRSLNRLRRQPKLILVGSDSGGQGSSGRFRPDLTLKEPLEADRVARSVASQLLDEPVEIGLGLGRAMLKR